MADALDSKSGVPSTCGFKSHLRYQKRIDKSLQYNVLRRFFVCGSRLYPADGSAFDFSQVGCPPHRASVRFGQRRIGAGQIGGGRMRLTAEPAGRDAGGGFEHPVQMVGVVKAAFVGDFA